MQAERAYVRIEMSLIKSAPSGAGCSNKPHYRTSTNYPPSFKREPAVSMSQPQSAAVTLVPTLFTPLLMIFHHLHIDLLHACSAVSALKLKGDPNVNWINGSMDNVSPLLTPTHS